MSFQQLVNSNFGKLKTGLSTVGVTIFNTDGTVYAARTTTGVYEITAGSGLYALYATFPNNFRGSIVWDSGEGTNTIFATEQFNYDERNPNVDIILSNVLTLTGSVNLAASDITFIKNIEGGGWKFINNQMVFYQADNATVVATFNLFDLNGNPTSDVVAERRRV